MKYYLAKKVTLIPRYALGALVVIAMYLVLFANGAVFKTDFRFWTFAMKVFDVEIMLLAIFRYAASFGYIFG